MDLGDVRSEPVAFRLEIAAEAAHPLGWQVSSLYRFGELWVGLAEGPEFDDYASGSGQFAEQALRRLSDRLRERSGRRRAESCLVSD
jgi:hypothetical protein